MLQRTFQRKCLKLFTQIGFIASQFVNLFSTDASKKGTNRNLQKSSLQSASMFKNKCCQQFWFKNLESRNIRVIKLQLNCWLAWNVNQFRIPKTLLLHFSEFCIYFDSFSIEQSDLTISSHFLQESEQKKQIWHESYGANNGSWSRNFNIKQLCLHSLVVAKEIEILEI